MRNACDWSTAITTTVHIPQYITSDVATVVNRMRESHVEIVNTNTTYI